MRYLEKTGEKRVREDNTTNHRNREMKRRGGGRRGERGRVKVLIKRVT